MQFLPPRRWFQFRLSTALVLVGILCWMLACRPYVVWVRGEPQIRKGDYFPLVKVNSILNPALLWPGLALSAFLGWKGACAFARSQEQHGVSSTRKLPERRWYRFRISTWLVVGCFSAALMCRPYVVRRVGQAPTFDYDLGYWFCHYDAPYTYSVVHPILAFLLPVLAALLGCKAVGVMAWLKSANASILSTEISRS